MKPASTQLIALLQSGRFLFADLYQFTLNSGATDYFSSLDVPVTYGGNTYKADSLRIDGLKFKIAVGLQVDEQEVRIGAYPGDTLAGADFLSTVGVGLLDGAYLLRSRAFWQRATGIAQQDIALPPIGVIALSNMLVSQITKIGRTHVEMKVKSPTKLMDLDMPRNYYSPGCIHTLYDSGCTLVKSAHGGNGAVGGPQSALTNLNIPWAGGVSPITSGDGLPSFAQGRLLFTSGVLNNLQVSIANNDGNFLYLTYPLQQLPNLGDTFTAYLGCSKTINSCENKFANLDNFRGFPFVPQVYVSV